VPFAIELNANVDSVTLPQKDYGQTHKSTPSRRSWYRSNQISWLKNISACSSSSRSRSILIIAIPQGAVQLIALPWGGILVAGLWSCSDVTIKLWPQLKDPKRSAHGTEIKVAWDLQINIFRNWTIIFLIPEKSKKI